ncbi:unnamed protein product [Microthlaspi erraticum]|uniref:Uncharacterized protein n=1 Tax=Microthlaspi erraticum TaxID=1685480 RepID=A0A6D2HG22_9BRAS|nr:unnamed protein product [Microthlaspi erraticum]
MKRHGNHRNTQFQHHNTQLTRNNTQTTRTTQEESSNKTKSRKFRTYSHALTLIWLETWKGRRDNDEIDEQHRETPPEARIHHEIAQKTQLLSSSQEPAAKRPQGTAAALLFAT